MTRCILCGEFIWNYIIEGSLEVKLPTIWTDQKAEMGRVREEKKEEERRKKKEGQKTERVRKQKESENRKSQKKEDAGARKGRQVAKHCVLPMFCGSGGSKSIGSLKRRVRSHLGR